MIEVRTVLGTNEFGGRITEEDAVKALKLLEEYGHDELDSSHVYQDGKCLPLIQKHAAEHVKVSTKANPWSGNSLKPESLRKQLQVALDDLNRNCVDIFYLHSPDKNTPITDTLQEVNKLYQEGKFIEFGISNYKSWQIAQICEICKFKGWKQPTVYQGVYSALRREAEIDIFPCLRHYNMRFYGYSPLSSGLLTGKHKFNDINQNKEGRFWTAQFNSVYKDYYWKEPYFRALEKLHKEIDEVYKSEKLSLTEASIRWLYHHSTLDGSHGDAVILGFSKLQQLESNLSFTMKGKLDAKVVAAFEDLWRETIHCSLADTIKM